MPDPFPSQGRFPLCVLCTESSMGFALANGQSGGPNGQGQNAAGLHWPLASYCSWEFSGSCRVFVLAASGSNSEP